MYLLEWYTNRICNIKLYESEAPVGLEVRGWRVQSPPTYNKVPVMIILRQSWRLQLVEKARTATSGSQQSIKGRLNVKVRNRR